ncbi:MAG: MBL fold metallo-hydrolase [Bacteroidota bacterium]
MLSVQCFTFNPYQENTYLVSDETKKCVIIDPGCYTASEQQELSHYIEQQGLTVDKLLNTHGHIDHMMGNSYVKDTYKVPFLTHKLVIDELDYVPGYAPMFGLNVAPSPHPDTLIDEGDEVNFGNTILKVFFTPGHSAGHISFFHAESKQLFSGDVLFQGSIGRTDLPGGSYPTLMQTIVNKILPLGDEVTVYSGHGPMTTIGEERVSNPFILQYKSGRY